MRKMTLGGLLRNITVQVTCGLTHFNTFALNKVRNNLYFEPIDRNVSVLNISSTHSSLINLSASADFVREECEERLYC